ncbi:helix-turn-helix transcriptional regulator [Micromonospora sp. HM5-17]|uniref:ArsR/SmtB family transcription factor n=1 Tax=Micromonospora sp. HM5-17 TaxID=2487710 RepID=UPI0011CDA194|nr:winged helix-turn-helix domain-containing protein [Micromonospora sp. HM5-17]
MIRIWLGAEDIARTRIAPAPLPLHEVVVSLAAAPTVDEPELARWLREVRDQPPSEPDAPSPAAHLLAALPEEHRLESALEWLVTNQTCRARSLAAAIRAHYDRHVRAGLVAWESVVRLDVDERSRALASGGVEALLGLLDPLATWRNPVLAVASPTELDLRPGGAGLLLVPSVFARQLWVGNHTGPAVVVYPVRRPGNGRRAGGRGATHLRTACASGPAVDPLTALLGRSRAAVLRAALVGANTTDLARRAGISTPSASQHASVLRDAGLLRTTRHGKAAHHTLTPLARALLTGHTGPARR